MSISIAPDGKLFKLDTQNSSYVFKVDESNYLLHLYYCKYISDFSACHELDFRYSGASFSPSREGISGDLSRNLVMQELTTNEIGDFRTSGIAVRTADGLNCTDPQFVAARTFQGKLAVKELPMCRINGDPDVETLEITLCDPFSKVEFILYYTIFPAQDVIVRSMAVRNGNADSVYLERGMSGGVDLPRCDFDFIHLAGTWPRERFAERTRLRSGIQSIYSKRSSSSHNHNPAFALVDCDANENFGDAYGFVLVYSGSFSAEIDVDAYSRTRVVTGINPENFEWKLTPGEVFQTPEVMLTFSENGLGGMSRNFHNMMREHLISPRWSHAERPILVNNWEATYFNFNDTKLLSIARDAADLGIEMLVLDDGWFGHRDSDNSSLGDWFVYDKKIGQLPELVKNINALGVKFGLWFEPEMISEDSELYRRHPEWVFTVPYRDRSVGRQQFVLNMSNPAVVDYLFEAIGSVIRSANIEYIKWDMNRQPAEKYCPDLPPDQQKEAGHRYVLGVYELHRRLLEAFPDLLIEGCSGGGGRFDAGMLYYVPQIWCSDNTDAIDRLSIQSGTSLFYPCSAHGAHVSVCPNHTTMRTTALATRGNVAMAGTFGYELDLNQLSAEDREIIKTQTALYHEVHHLVSDGDFYRLIPVNDRQAAWMFVAKDGSEAMVFYAQILAKVCRGAFYLRMRGLQDKARYQLLGTEKVFYGDTLMNSGLPIPFLRKDGDSVLWHFKRIK